MAEISIEEQWKNFKFAHNKNYEEEEEEKRRFEIFKKNVKEIEEHNKKFESGEESYKKGINKFADLTEEDMKSFMGLRPQ